MTVETSKGRTWARRLQILAIALTVLLLAGTFAFLAAEATWAEPRERSPEEAFAYGTTGCEIMPLPVFTVLPELFPEHFQPAGPKAGDWIEQFGFIRGKAGVNEGLPQGFQVSRYRPRSGAPSPVPFVGANCSLCHTSMIKRFPGDPGVYVPGMGSTSLDFIAWVDAVRSAILDEKRLTPATIENAWESRSGQQLGPLDKVMIQAWLSNARSRAQENLPKVDAPYGGAELRDSRFLPNGPSRTQPFRNLVRNIMDRPAHADRAFGKFPALYEQKNRDWGQFDGTVRNRVTRSVLAALAVGATLDNLMIPDITRSVGGAIEYSLNLKGPSYAEVFKQQGITIDAARAERGRVVYMKSCAGCHGSRGAGGAWGPGKQQGVVFAATALGTDPERVNFRYYDNLADTLYAQFPAKHPLKPKREDLRPGPLGRTRGYISSPLESVFSRTPYFHNGSVPTLAELINLKPRREVFYRGDTLYDPVDVGLAVPAVQDAKNYFRFDTRERGNSNRGHDYPWAYQGPGWDRAALEDLLEFLKTL
jgi:mono/diheme cytochrome c family protein